MNALPLKLEVVAVPAIAPVDAKLDLVVRLTNPLDESVVVNRRLLLLPLGMPERFGELALDVGGPPGYQNVREIHVRTGPPRPEDFVKLAPGEAVERSVPLWRYESLHVPGQYTLSVTYHNTVPFALEGHTALVGIATAQTMAERVAN